MTKMRMKSPAFSILEIIFDYQDLLKKSMHVHTQKSGKGWIGERLPSLRTFVSVSRWVF